MDAVLDLTKNGTNTPKTSKDYDSRVIIAIARVQIDKRFHVKNNKEVSENNKTEDKISKYEELFENFSKHIRNIVPKTNNSNKQDSIPFKITIDRYPSQCLILGVLKCRTEDKQWFGEIREKNVICEFNLSALDDINFIRDTLLKEDLDYIDTNIEDHDISIEKIQLLPSLPQLSITFIDKFNIKLLIGICNLSLYHNEFICQNINSYGSLLPLSTVSLRSDLKIAPFRHRKRSLYYIDEVKGNFEPITGENIKNVPESNENLKDTSNSCLNFNKTKETSAEINNTSFPRNLSLNRNRIKLDTRNASPHTDYKFKFPEGLFPRQNGRENNISLKSIDDSIIKQKKSLIKKSSSKNPLDSYKPKHVSDKNKSLNIESLVSKIKKIMVFKKSSKYDDQVAIQENETKCILKHVFIKKTKNVYSEEKSNVWVFEDQLLLQSCVKIQVAYLGTCPVKNVRLKNKEMVYDSLWKLKASSSLQPILPQLTLNISAFEIKLINFNSKKVISMHEMESILFCSQDISDLRIFCYVFHDKILNNFFCNVFRTKSIKISNTTCLTIGQAFELNLRLKKFSNTI